MILTYLSPLGIMHVVFLNIVRFRADIQMCQNSAVKLTSLSPINFLKSLCNKFLKIFYEMFDLFFA